MSEESTFSMEGSICIYILCTFLGYSLFGRWGMVAFPLALAVLVIIDPLEHLWGWYNE